MAPNGWQRKTTNVLLLDFFKVAASSTKIARISRFSCFVPYSMSQDQFWHVHSLARISVSWDMSDMLQKYAKIRSAIPAILASPVVLPAAAGVLVVALLSLRRGRQPWLEVDHACLHSFFVLEERTFEWQCFRVQSEHNQHLIRTAKLVNDTFRQLFSGVALALWWCMDSSILATTTASFVATLPGLSSCLPFFFPLGSIITRHNQFWFSKASWKSPSELVLSVWQWKLTNYWVERIGDNIWDTHTHTMHKEWEEQLCSYMAPLRMPSFHSMGMNVHLVFIYIIWYINIIYIYIFVEKCTCVPCKRLI